MKSDAEKKFELLMKDMMENTSFTEELFEGYKEAGYDAPPDIESIKARAAARKNRNSGRFRNPRFLKVAGFIFGIFAVSTIMTISINSDFATASKFHLNNIMFNIKNGFVSTDLRLDTTPGGMELLIEDEALIHMGKNYLKELKTPGYIPEGYEFISLRITNNQRNDYEAAYVYENDSNDFLIITQLNITNHIGNTIITGIEDDFYIGDMRVFYTPDRMSEYRSIHAFNEHEMMFINGQFELDVLIKIIEMFQ